MGKTKLYILHFRQDLNINTNNLKVILDEITVLKNYFQNDIYFEFDEDEKIYKQKEDLISYKK